MKFLLLALILFSFHSLLSQDNPLWVTNAVDHKDFALNGLPFRSAKSAIIKEFGTPRRIFEPKNECGFFSEDEQEKTFYTLEYPQFQFTGNDTDGYDLEEFNFIDSQYHVTYKGSELSARTTRKQFQEIFGITSKEDEVVLYYKNLDCSLILEFLDGHLWKMHFWSPC